MKIWLNYAYIKNGKIENIGSFLYTGYTEAQIVAKQLYGNEAFAVDVTQYPVKVGDDYVDGLFYRDGVKIDPLPTDEQDIERLKVENESLNSAVDDLAVAILEG